MSFASVSITFLGLSAAAYAAAGWWPVEESPRQSMPDITATAPVDSRVSRYSGLPLPRFVSLKTSKVNVRRGPSRQHPIAWSFTKRGIPVEIVRESENWRMIRDSEGGEGWIYQGLLSGARSVIIAPWDGLALHDLRNAPKATASITARFEAGVVAKIEECSGVWCRIDAGGYDGWIVQGDLWGVYPGEVLD